MQRVETDRLRQHFWTALNSRGYRGTGCAAQHCAYLVFKELVERRRQDPHALLTPPVKGKAELARSSPIPIPLPRRIDE